MPVPQSATFFFHCCFCCVHRSVAVASICPRLMFCSFNITSSSCADCICSSNTCLTSRSFFAFSFWSLYSSLLASSALFCLFVSVFISFKDILTSGSPSSSPASFRTADIFSFSCVTSWCAFSLSLLTDSLAFSSSAFACFNTSRSGVSCGMTASVGWCMAPQTGQGSSSFNPCASIPACASQNCCSILRYCSLICFCSAAAFWYCFWVFSLSLLTFSQSSNLFSSSSSLRILSDTSNIAFSACSPLLSAPESCSHVSFCCCKSLLFTSYDFCTFSSSVPSLFTSLSDVFNCSAISVRSCIFCRISFTSFS